MIRMMLSSCFTPGLASNLYFVIFLMPLFFDISTVQATCDKSKILQDEGSLKNMVTHADIAVKGLITNTYPDENNWRKDAYIAEVWLLDVYKGANWLVKNLGIEQKTHDKIFEVKDRRVNISHWRDEAKCWEKLVNQKTYIIMMQSSTDDIKTKKEEEKRNGLEKVHLKSKSENDFGGAVEFTQDLENRINDILGWKEWGEWSSCSSSCGGGKQERKRSCQRKSSHHTLPSYQHCSSYDTEQRMCNSFECEGSVNALSVKESRYFKPSPSAFHMVKGRSAWTWKIKPGSYFLLPYKQAFGQDFPRDSFTVFLTLKPSKDSEGVIFSLNARNSRQEHISLELKEGRIELVHSLPNGSNIIDIPAKISDGKWHQLAISIDRGSSVRTHLDCQWITTQILHQHSLYVPANTDLIVGYMFQGEIEQLTISKESSAVSKQCASSRIPITTRKNDGFDHNDEMFEMQGDDPDVHVHTSRKKNIDDKSRSNEPYDYLEEEYVDLDTSDFSSKEFTKENLKNTQDTEKLKVGKYFQKEKAIEGSGETEYGITREDDEDLENDDEKEGSGIEENFLRPHGMKNYEYSNEITNNNKEKGLKEKFEIEWSSWSDCYVVSKGKKLHKLYSITARSRASYSKCGILKFSGRQYRTSRCMDNGFMEECIAAGKEHRRQTRKCTPSCNQKLVDLKPPPRYLYEKDFVLDNSKDKSKSNHQRQIDDYELVTIGDVEEVKRRKTVKNYEKQGVYADQMSSNLLDIKSPYKSKHKSNQVKNNQSLHIKEIGESGKNLSNISFAHKNEVLIKEGIEETRESQASYNNRSLQSGGSTRNSFNCFCKNGGTCLDNGVCHCPTGYSGKRCETPNCRPKCLNGGQCVDVNVCNCKDGYTGARCQKAFCHPECLNGGSCIAPFKCACPLGVSGMYCQEFSCQPKCANGGFCIGHNTCSCPHGFSGPLCQDRTCTIHCENGGVCTMPENKCKCRNGFYGSRCHKRICKTYVSIMKPHRQLYKRVVNVEYDSICGEKNLPCKKFRPEHRTFIKIVQRPTFVCKSDILDRP